MKKIVSIFLSLFFCITLFAQKDVTKFLGFPVDGSKAVLVRNLKTKGFKVPKNGSTDYLTGRFNGADVDVYIATENGKVCRIMVCDVNTMDETDIKIRFNTLCRQFENNAKYISLDDYIIPDDEDIADGITIKNKRYEAIFYQLPQGKTIEDLNTLIMPNLQAKYAPEELENPSGDMKDQLFLDYLSEVYKLTQNRPVWFKIANDYGKYYIIMYYDNELNRPHGEDL